jgi:hypothetical protein
MSEPSEWLTAYSVKAPEDMNATSLFYGGRAPVYPCCNDSLNRIYTTDVSAVLKGILEGKKMVSAGGCELNISKLRVNDLSPFSLDMDGKDFNGFNDYHFIPFGILGDNFIFDYMFIAVWEERIVSMDEPNLNEKVATRLERVFFIPDLRHRVDTILKQSHNYLASGNASISHAVDVDAFEWMGYNRCRKELKEDIKTLLEDLEKTQSFHQLMLQWKRRGSLGFSLQVHREFEAASSLFEQRYKASYGAMKRMVSLFKVFHSNYLKGERIFLRRDMKALAMLPDLVEDFCSQADKAYGDMNRLLMDSFPNSSEKMSEAQFKNRKHSF